MAEDQQIGVIYLLTNRVNNKKYVGFTTNLKKRLSSHVQRSKERSYHLANAIKKYGFDNFDCQELVCGKDIDYIKNVMEPFFIKELNTLSENGLGYNLTCGGEGTIGYKKTDFEKAKMSLTRTGRKLSDFHKKQISNAFLGEKNPNYGKKHSAETRKKISEGIKRRIATHGNPNSWTKERRKAASVRQKFKKKSQTHIENIRKAAFLRRGKPGRPHTERHKKYMSEKMKGRIISDKAKWTSSIKLSIHEYTIKSPENDIYTTISINAFGRKNNISHNTLKRTFENNRPCLKGRSRGWQVIKRENATQNIKEKYLSQELGTISIKIN